MGGRLSKGRPAPSDVSEVPVAQVPAPDRPTDQQEKTKDTGAPEVPAGAETDAVTAPPSPPSREKDHVLILDLMEYFCFAVKPTTKFRGVCRFRFHAETPELGEDLELDVAIYDPEAEGERPRVVVHQGAAPADAPVMTTVCVPYEQFLLIYSGHASARDISRLIWSRQIKVSGWKELAKFAYGFDYHKEVWYGMYAERDRLAALSLMHEPSLSDASARGAFLFSSDNFRHPESYTRLATGRSRNKGNVAAVLERKQRSGGGSGGGGGGGSCRRYRGLADAAAAARGAAAAAALVAQHGLHAHAACRCREAAVLAVEVLERRAVEVWARRGVARVAAPAAHACVARVVTTCCASDCADRFSGRHGSSGAAAGGDGGKYCGCRAMP
eukprot:TRINITY_DN1153_c0_g1_i1.p1 TRINITY_DN1153_c0_g1~~TRINITY_DN1153_c0_g1_i1.p1  ORF type:complete len:400 (-),score=108.43 TRINITY_DN1153_c0_g1_i1:483-1637(-)